MGRTDQRLVGQVEGDACYGVGVAAGQLDLVGCQAVGDDIINVSEFQRGLRGVTAVVINDRVPAAQAVAAAHCDGIVGRVNVRVREQVILVDQRAVRDIRVRGRVQCQNGHRTGNGSLGALCVGLYEGGEQAVLHTEIGIDFIDDVADAVQFQILDLIR